MSDKQNSIFSAAYDPETFRKQGYQVIDMLSEYMNSCIEEEISSVLPVAPPSEVLKKWETDFDAPQSFELNTFVTEVIKQSNHLHHPKYIGHQCSAPLPESVLANAVSAMLNNGSAIFEMGPVNTAMERICISWMGKQVGFDSKSEGFFTSGGTLGNLTALLAARQAKAGYNIWNEGMKSDEPLAIMVSEQAHYSVKRAAQVMGLGEKGVILIPTDVKFKMDVTTLKDKYNEATSKGLKVFAVVASCCSTATGSYDDLNAIADFCEKYDLWLHIDAAHGASALLSSKYNHLLAGSHRADSIVWDAHKMLLQPALITAVIFKNGQCSYETFSQKASYLASKDTENKWSDLYVRTMECTKTMHGFKVYMTLKAKGKQFLADYIDYVYDLTKWFAGALNESSDFELAIQPECNIICFRYTGKEGNLNSLQEQILKRIAESESFYIVKATLEDKLYLRCTIINPLTTKQDLFELIEKIRSVA